MIRDQGLAEFYDDSALTGIYFAPASVSGISATSGDRTSQLATAMDRFVVPTVLAPRGERGAIVQRKEAVSLGGEPALAALVDVPGASGAFDPATGQRFTSRVGTILFVRGAHVFAITDQNSFWDLDAKTKDPSEDLQRSFLGRTGN